MKRLITAAVLTIAALFAAPAFAALTDAQSQTLATAIRADSDPAVVTFSAANPTLSGVTLAGVVGGFLYNQLAPRRPMILPRSSITAARRA